MLIDEVHRTEITVSEDQFLLSEALTDCSTITIQTDGIPVISISEEMYFLSGKRFSSPSALVHFHILCPSHVPSPRVHLLSKLPPMSHLDVASSGKFDVRKYLVLVSKTFSWKKCLRWSDASFKASFCFCLINVDFGQVRICQHIMSSEFVFSLLCQKQKNLCIH